MKWPESPNVVPSMVLSSQKFRPQILKFCSLLKAGDDALRIWADSDHVKPWPEYEGGLIGLAGICLISSIIGLIW